MLGLMQNWPLLIHRIIDHAAIQHGTREVVTRAVEDGGLRRRSYAQIRSRALQAAKRLTMEGIGPGDRIATLAWNEHRHLEAYYAVSAMGAVLHTVNPRLFPGQIAYILADAADTHLLVDPTLLAGAEALADQLPDRLRTVIVMGTEADLPAECPLRGRCELLAQESLIAGQPTSFPWPELDERSASSLCYTSGTTGEPKGVLYSHRSTVIHAISTLQKDCFNIGAGDVVMPVVPMFHVNAWGIP